MDIKPLQITLNGNVYHKAPISTAPRYIQDFCEKAGFFHGSNYIKIRSGNKHYHTYWAMNISIADGVHLSGKFWPLKKINTPKD